MKEIIPSDLWNVLSSKFQNLVPAKYRKWLIPALALVLILNLILVSCSLTDSPAEEVISCTVSADNLNVHKTYDPDSSILGQLPLDLEIQIQEQKSANGAHWGRIDKTKLPDGTKVKAGWINMQYVALDSASTPAPGGAETTPTETTPTEAGDTNVG